MIAADPDAVLRARNENVPMTVVRDILGHTDIRQTEIYAHIAVAEHEGMSDQRLSELCANIKPNDLSAEESVAYDVAFALVNGGVLPEPCYRLAVATFGQHGANELIYLVGLYCLVSMTLNGFNVPVPERE